MDNQNKKQKNLKFDNLLKFLINYLDQNPEDGFKLITHLRKKYPKQFLKGSGLYKKVLSNYLVYATLKSRTTDIVENMSKNNALLVELRKKNMTTD